MPSAHSSPTPPRATICARPCTRHPTWRARWRGCRSGAAARAIWRRLPPALPRPTTVLARLDRMQDAPQEIAARGRGAAPAAARAGAGILRARSPTNCRLLKRDGGFVRAGYEPALDEARALRDEVAPRRRRDAGALCRRDRREGAEDPAQQRARLFRRGDRAARRQADVAAAERDLHPSPDAGRPGALHHRRARPDRSEDRQRRRPRAWPRAGNLRAARGHGHRRLRRPACGGAGVRRARRRDRAGKARLGPELRPPGGRRLAGFRDRGRTASGGRAGAARATASPSSPTPAICRRAAARPPGKSGSSPVRTWPANRPSCARTR